MVRSITVSTLRCNTLAASIERSANLLRSKSRRTAVTNEPRLPAEALREGGAPAPRCEARTVRAPVVRFVPPPKRFVGSGGQGRVRCLPAGRQALRRCSPAILDSPRKGRQAGAAGAARRRRAAGKHSLPQPLPVCPPHDDGVGGATYIFGFTRNFFTYALF